MSTSSKSLRLSSFPCLFLNAYFLSAPFFFAASVCTIPRDQWPFVEVLPDEYERELETIDVYIAKIDCKQTNPLLKYVLSLFGFSFFFLLMNFQ